MLYTFVDQQLMTTILFDSGSTVSLIDNDFAIALGLKGFPLKTLLYKACKTKLESSQAMHYNVRMKDRSGNIFMIRMIGVRHICQSQELPNFDNILTRFPWLPEGSIERPRTKIGILLGQNANVLLPGCEEDVRFGNIHIRKSRLGDYGYIPDGSNESLWNFETTRKTFIPHMFP